MGVVDAKGGFHLEQITYLRWCRETRDFSSHEQRRACPHEFVKIERRSLRIFERSAGETSSRPIVLAGEGPDAAVRGFMEFVMHEIQASETSRFSSPSIPSTAPSLWGRTKMGRQDPPSVSSIEAKFTPRAVLE